MRKSFAGRRCHHGKRGVSTDKVDGGRVAEREVRKEKIDWEKPR